MMKRRFPHFCISVGRHVAGRRFVLGKFNHRHAPRSAAPLIRTRRSQPSAEHSTIRGRIYSPLTAEEGHGRMAFKARPHNSCGPHWARSSARRGTPGMIGRHGGRRVRSKRWPRAGLPPFFVPLMHHRLVKRILPSRRLPDHRWCLGAQRTCCALTRFPTLP